jgi:glycine cleavage system H protein
MTQVRYTKDHEYIRIENGVGTVGITNHAQEKLGDVTYVELPAAGKTVMQSDPVGVVESVKAASDVYTPVSGEIIEVNPALAQTPELVNKDAEGAAWFFKIRLADPSELDHLLERDAYISFAEGEV